MDHDIPADLQAYLAELDEFIENEIIPLEQKDDNIRFFDPVSYTHLTLPTKA